MKILKQMRKMCVLAAVISMLVTLVACGAAEETASGNKPVKKKIEYLNAAGDYYMEYVYDYNEAGSLVKQITTEYKTGEVTKQQISTYNADGKLVQYEFLDGFADEIIEYVYGACDENGYLVEEIKKQYDYRGNEKISRTYTEYDIHDNLIRDYGVDEEGNPWESDTYNVYEYYEDGTIKREERYDTKTGVLEKKRDYDGNGNFYIEEYFTDGVCRLRSLLEYDENGELVFYQEYKANEDLELVLEYESAVFEEENEFRYTFYNADGSVDETGALMYNCEFPEYDRKGRLVSKKVYHAISSDDYYLYQYEYDKEGNLTKETCYNYHLDNNGKVERWTEYYY